MMKSRDGLIGYQLLIGRIKNNFGGKLKMTTAAFVRPRIDRSAIALTGILPEGSQLIVDTMPLKIVDFKKAITEGKDGKSDHQR
jgi:hypothetical protein